jgi:predicted dehydrogenase
MIDNRTQAAAGMKPRRAFLQAAAASLAVPWIVPSSALGQNAPSKRINVAFLGAGNQSRVDLPSMLNLNDVQVIAVCDVNRASHGYARPEHFLGREPAQALVNAFYAKKTDAGSYKGCDAHADFREVLARRDVDAVMVVTPDHWHALMSVMAAKAGKDVYCQKPMTLTVREGEAMIKAVRQHNRILQTGSQYRSNRVVRQMCELIRNGRIGRVQRVTAMVPDSPSGPGPGWQPMPVPEGFDYERWLGPAPAAPYHSDRCFYRFRFILDYSGGQVTNTGAHSLDIVQWALGTDATGPVEFEDQGAVFPPAGHLFNTAIDTQVRARYDNGVELVCRTQKPGFGARFEGTEGWIEYSSGVLTSQPESLKDSAIGPQEIHLPVSEGHYRNFVDAVKSREDPIEPVEIGHRTATICHLGNLAMRLRRKIAWDPAAQCCPKDDEANAMLDRPHRSPWELQV